MQFTISGATRGQIQYHVSVPFPASRAIHLNRARSPNEFPCVLFLQQPFESNIPQTYTKIYFNFSSNPTTEHSEDGVTVTVCLKIEAGRFLVTLNSLNLANSGDGPFSGCRLPKGIRSARFLTNTRPPHFDHGGHPETEWVYRVSHPGCSRARPIE
jgi:hypothetical protein